MERDAGNWLRSELHDRFVVETTGWAADQVARVAQRLQFDIDEGERLIVEVLWIEAFTAFTAPGRYIYVSRRLLELCRHDEAVAFMIAHELAHHLLGHLALFPPWLVHLTNRHVAALLAAVLHRNIEARLYGPEREVQADLTAIDLCTKAGYDPKKCLELFDVLEKFALDMRDIDIVFGPEEADDELDSDVPIGKKLRIWVWQRIRGYLPIRDRRYQILKHLERGHAAS